jgi:CheY-like chemotaxis protein
LLQSRGYEIEIAGTGRDALRIASERRPELIVLDLGLPDMEGTEVCRRIRSESAVPIIVLSARGGEADKVSALDLGADDYVTKPFNPEELLARIRVALRRVFSAEDGDVGRVQCGDLAIDYDRHRVMRGDDEIRLTPKEFDLLSAGAQPRPRVDAPCDFEGRVGAERRRSAGAPVGPGRAAAEEARARSVEPALPDQRALGRVTAGNDFAGDSLGRGLPAGAAFAIKASFRSRRSRFSRYSRLSASPRDPHASTYTSTTGRRPDV